MRVLWNEIKFKKKTIIGAGKRKVPSRLQTIFPELVVVCEFFYAQHFYAAKMKIFLVFSRHMLQRCDHLS